MSPEERGALEALLGHTFAAPEHLERAVTHASAAEAKAESNERLEFLGDAVLDLVLSERLFVLHPEWQEGNLTRARAALVNTGALASRARELGLGRFVRLGPTEQRSGGERKDRVLANLFEAVVGALYLDGGLAAVNPFVERTFAAALEADDEMLERDPKTELQEWSHRRFQETPAYRLVLDTGEEDGEDRFTVEVQLQGERWGGGAARSKQRAERRAAREALARIRAQEGPA